MALRQFKFQDYAALQIAGDSNRKRYSLTPYGKKEIDGDFYGKIYINKNKQSASLFRFLR